MDAVAGLELGRQAHHRQVWTQAFAYLTEADTTRPLAADDLERAAEAANMLGRGDDEVRLLRRAYLAHADAGQVAAALRLRVLAVQGAGVWWRVRPGGGGAGQGAAG
jgi:hypothetical protein